MATVRKVIRLRGLALFGGFGIMVMAAVVYENSPLAGSAVYLVGVGLVAGAIIKA